MRLESLLWQRRRFVRFSSAFLALCLPCLTAFQHAPAADATWAGGTGTQAWAEDTNWNPAAAPGATTGTANGDTATFNSNVAGTAITIDPSRNIKNITFGSAATGAITFGSAGANLGSALLLTSGGSFSTTLGNTATITVDAPLIIQPTSSTGAGSYTFSNNNAATSATTDTNANKIYLNGDISGGATTGTITLNFGGTAGNRSSDTSGNEVNGIISNGAAGAVAVNVATVNNQNGVWKFTNANNSYTGATTVSTGTLIFTSIANAGVNSALGAGSSIVMGSGVHLKYSGPSASTDRAISGNGSFYNTSSGTTLTLTGSVTLGFTFRGNGNFDVVSVLTGGSGVSRTDGGTVFLSNDNNSFSGNVSISDGAFRGATLFDSGVNSAFGKGSAVYLGQGSATVGRMEYTGVSTSSNRIFIMRNDSSGNTGRGVIDVTAAGQTLTLTGGVRVNNAASANVAELTFRGVGNGEFTGQIGGTASNPAASSALKVVKDGAGTWTLSGANTYGRETTVNAGILNIRNDAALGAVLSYETTPTAAAAGTTVANNATLQIQNDISVGAEQLTLSGNGFTGQSGALVNVSGTNSIAGDVILAANTTIGSDAGRLNLTSASALAGSGGSRTLTLAGAGDGSISAGLASTISNLTKNGAGLWTLGATSAHTGATTVNAGTLNLAGGISGTGLVTVNNTATLAAQGTVAGGLTLANGATLIVGNAEVAGSTGTLTVSGNLVLNNMTTLRYDLGTSSDLIVVNGALTLDGLLSVTKGAGFTTGTYKLMDYSGSITDNGLAFIANTVGYDATIAVDGANMDVNLVVTAIDGQYWDGADTAADGAVDGGSGVWTNAGNNWTNVDGSANTSWSAATPKVAFFEGAAGGTVTVQDAVAVAGLQFGKDYTLAAGGGSLQIATAATEFRVVSGVTATLEAPVTGAGGINKTGEGTLVFTAAPGGNTYTGTTQVSAGTLKLGTTNTLPVTGAMILGANTTTVGLINPAVALDLSTASQQLASLQVAVNNTTPSTVTIGAGQTLSITGSGGYKTGIASTAKAQTHVIFTGGGALVVSNASANFESGLQPSTTVIPGGDSPFDAGGNTNNSSTNLFDLSSFTANVNELRVGHGLNNTSTLTLSNTSNTITANTVNIANSANLNSGTGTLILGAGTNVISANAINIGVSKGNGIVKFASQTAGSAGAVVIGGKTGAAADITVGSSLGTGTAASPTGTLDLRGHLATVTADDLIIARRSSNGNGGTTGTVYFDGGTFTANKVEIGTMSGDGGSSGVPNAIANGQLIISGGTFTVNTGGSLTLATYANTNTYGIASGTLTISGGTFISNVDLLEGVTAGSTVTNTVSTLNLSGGTLDMTGHNIGSATETINNVNLTAGTLKDVGEVNGGAALTKTDTGTLALQGDNGFTGGITAAGGTLLVSNTPATSGSGSATGSGDVSIASGATLGGNGRITGNVALAAGSALAAGGNATTIAASAPPPGLGTDTGTLIIGGDLTVGANASLTFDLKTGGSHGLNATFDPVTNLLTGVSGTSTDGGNDRLVVQGTTSFDTSATITVTLGSGYTGGYQDTFDLVDWTGVTLPLSYYDDGDGTRSGGTADNAGYNLDLPDLTPYNSGWFWDVSQFGTTGVIAIVPEPSRAVLGFLGLAGLLLRRRRSSSVA